MGIDAVQARELAALLPAGLSMDSGRERLLSVAEALRLLTDARHPMSNSELRLVFEQRFGAASVPAENTLNADILALRKRGFMGYTVHTGPRGSWCESSRLSQDKLRLLLNAVQTSRALATKESAQLQDSLLDLVSVHQEEELVGEVHVVQRMGHEGRAVLAACNTIAEALRTRRKVAFEYAYYDFNGKQVALEGDYGETLRIETPIALFFSEGNYYLESHAAVPWRRGQHITRSRLDRMRSIAVADEAADDLPEIERAKRSATRRMKREFEMLGGKKRTVFLRVSAEKTNEMYDRFGFGLVFTDFDGAVGDKTTTGLTCVTVAQSMTFFRWLAGQAGGVRIVPPPSELALAGEPWVRTCPKVGADKLAEDYRAMAEGYREFLCAAEAGV